MSPMSEPCPTSAPRFAASPRVGWTRLGSRKTKTLLVTLGLALAAPHLGIPAALVPWLLGLGATGVAAQGVADIKTGGSRR